MSFLRPQGNLFIKLLGFRGNYPGYVYFLSHSDVPVRVLEACDTALNHVARSRKKRRGPTDHEIGNALRKLLMYERDFHAK